CVLPVVARVYLSRSPPRVSVDSLVLHPAKLHDLVTGVTRRDLVSFSQALEPPTIGKNPEARQSGGLSSAASWPLGYLRSKCNASPWSGGCQGRSHKRSQPRGRQYRSGAQGRSSP